MSLDFNYTKCDAPEGLTHDHLTTCPDDADRWHPVGDALVWLSMFCDFGHIEDVEDVWKRIAFYQTLYGPHMVKSGGEWLYITKEDVALYKGLRTNVITVPFQKWATKMVKKWVEHKDFDHVGEKQAQSAFWYSEQFRKPESLVKKEAA